MFTQLIYKVLLSGRNFFLPSCRCDVAVTKTGRIRPGFMLTEKGLTELHMRPNFRTLTDKILNCPMDFH